MASEQFWTFWSRDKSLIHFKIQILACLACGLMTVLAELSSPYIYKPRRYNWVKCSGFWAQRHTTESLFVGKAYGNHWVEVWSSEHGFLSVLFFEINHYHALHHFLLYSVSLMLW